MFGDREREMSMRVQVSGPLLIYGSGIRLCITVQHSRLAFSVWLRKGKSMVTLKYAQQQVMCPVKFATTGRELCIPVTKFVTRDTKCMTRDAKFMTQDTKFVARDANCVLSTKQCFLIYQLNFL